MTATLTRQARLDQLNAEEQERKDEAARKVIERAQLSALIELDELIRTCAAMTNAIEQGDYATAHTHYDGSKAGPFWGPVTRIQSAMGKLK